MTRNQKRQMRLSRQQEKRNAEALGGRRHAYSGSRPDSDGDGHVGDDIRSMDYILLESKRTNGNRQITIKRDDLEKLAQEALRQGREPIMNFELSGKDYLILERDYLVGLLAELRALTEAVKKSGILDEE